MTLSLRSLLPPLLSALLSVGLGSGAIAASPQATAHGHALRMSSVKIAITATGGTVWGTVSASYTYQRHTTRRSCSAASCTLRVPQGVTLRLSQAAKSTATWPFQDWQVTAHQRRQTVMGSSIAVKVTGNTSVTAVYVLQSQSSSGNGGYGPGW